jgi:DNA-binding MarR family transcriptional regulator
VDKRNLADLEKNYNYCLYIQILSYLCPAMAHKDTPYCKCLLFSSNALARVMTRMADEEFGIFGIGYSHAFIMIMANSEPGKPIGEISDRMMLSPSTVTRLVMKLEGMNYLERQVDGRVTHIFPTDKSKKLDDHLKLAWRKVYERYNSLLGTENAAKLTEEIFNAALVLEQK